MWPRPGRQSRIADEIADHRERLIAEYVSRGMRRDAAERRAFLDLGNPLQIEEAVRDARGRWLADLMQDIQYAGRMFRRSPGFFTVAILSLALGIGANSAIFSVINAVMLRPLPVERPGWLVQIGRRLSSGRPGFVPYPVFELFRDHLTSTSGVLAQTASAQSIVLDGDDDFVAVDAVSGGYFGVLGVRPAAGRLLDVSDDTVSSDASAAVITDAYWQRRFGRDGSALGKSFTLRGRIYTIVGAAPPGFQGAQTGRSTDVIVPLLTILSPDQRKSLGWNSLAILGRLAPGASLAQATAEVDARFSAFMQSRADAAGLTGTRRDEVLRQRAMARSGAAGFNPIGDSIAGPLALLMGIVALILILACVNLSGLLLARAEARHREISIRLAIGAGRDRIVRQLLTESLALAVLGGAAGFALACWLSRPLFALLISGRDVALSAAPDWRVLTFTGGVSLVACVASGLVPALRAVRDRINPALKEVRASRRAPMGRALVAAQCAISMVLVVGSTLFVGTLVHLYGVDRGFNTDGVLIVNVRSAGSYPPDRAREVQSALLDRLRAVPGVRSAGAAQAPPISGGLWDRGVQVEGYAPRPDEPNVPFNVIAPGFFATLQTPVVAGRDFTDRDTSASPRVAIVNESFVKYFFGIAPPLGRRVTSAGVTYQIVGVVRDAKYQNLREDRLRTLYVPWTQYDGAQPSAYAFLVRAEDDRLLQAGTDLDRLVRGVDPGLRVRTAQAYDAMVSRSIAVERLMAILGGLFGALGLIVAGLGMFGLLAFQVTRRTREIGIRMVLGASGTSVATLILREVATLVLAGAAVGALGAMSVARLTRELVFGLSPTDPRVFGVAALALIGSALIAAWLPARRAFRVNPLTALREE